MPLVLKFNLELFVRAAAEPKASGVSPERVRVKAPAFRRRMFRQCVFEQGLNVLSNQAKRYSPMGAVALNLLRENRRNCEGLSAMDDPGRSNGEFSAFGRPSQNDADLLAISRAGWSPGCPGVAGEAMARLSHSQAASPTAYDPASCGTLVSSSSKPRSG